MKKFVFTVQVFGIIALFPIYVILEMNHGLERLPESGNPHDAKMIIKEATVQVSQNVEAEKGIFIPGKILINTTALPGKTEIIKALAEAAHNAY